MGQQRVVIRRRAFVTLACGAALAAACGGSAKETAIPNSTSLAGPFAGESIPVSPPSVASASEEAGTPAAPEQASAPRPPAPSEGASLVRMVIPKAKVNNRLVVKGLNERREMEDPGSKDDIAWYNFSTLPGLGSNAVFSGHVDWYTGDRGVFWYLRDLRDGDEAQVQYSDGLSITYRVVRVDVYGANNAPVAEITGPTAKDVITMITCEGVFQRGTGDYTQRRVVVAERVVQL